MEISQEQLIKMQYDKEKVIPGLAWLNLFGLSFVGGLGYYTTSKGDSEQIMKGAAWSATSLILFMMARSYLLTYSGFVWTAICIYIFLVVDTVRLFFERKKHNETLLEDIKNKVNDNDKSKHQTSPISENKGVATKELTTADGTKPDESSKTAPANNRITKKEFQDMVVALNNDRVRNGYEPLPVSKFDYIDYAGKDEEEDTDEH